MNEKRRAAPWTSIFRPRKSLWRGEEWREPRPFFPFSANLLLFWTEYSLFHKSLFYAFLNFLFSFSLYFFVRISCFLFSVTGLYMAFLEFFINSFGLHKELSGPEQKNLSFTFRAQFCSFEVKRREEFRYILLFNVSFTTHPPPYTTHPPPYITSCFSLHSIFSIYTPNPIHFIFLLGRHLRTPNGWEISSFVKRDYSHCFLLQTSRQETFS